MISFELLNIKDIQWKDIDSIGEVNVFQTQAWLEFLMDAHKGELVLAAIKRDSCIIGYFTGLIVTKFGLRILGSPFRGWTTYFMGFNLLPYVLYQEILKAFPSFVFNELRCHYFEIIDPNIKEEDFLGLNYRINALPWYALDLTPSEEDMFSSMKSSGRRAIRKSINNSVTIEEAMDACFVQEYYQQYIEVLGKRSLAPTYSLETVQNMVDHMQVTGNLLLLRARNLELRSVATGIFVSCNKKGVYWGAASWREYQYLRPNEPIIWYAMRALKARGIKEIHMGAECEQFKEKMGSYKVKIYRLMKAKNIILDLLLNLVFSQKGARFKNFSLRKL